jgi:hypothetical protein
MKDRVLNWYFHDLTEVRFCDMTRREGMFVAWRMFSAVAFLGGFVNWAVNCIA